VTIISAATAESSIIGRRELQRAALGRLKLIEEVTRYQAGAIRFAADVGRDQEAKIREGRWTDPNAGKLTLGEWIERWLAV
jgi:hypothetical protein